MNGCRLSDGTFSVLCSNKDTGESRLQHGCGMPHRTDTILGHSSGAGASDPEYGDFKVPMNSEVTTTTSPHACVPTSLLQMNEELPLKTPEKQLLSSAVAQEVKKRSMEVSPTSADEDPKRRQVSKTLVFSSPSPSPSSSLKLLMTGNKGGVARCIFGTPTKEGDEQVMRACQERIREDYERFTKRYIIVDDDGEELVPSPYYTS